MKTRLLLILIASMFVFEAGAMQQSAAMNMGASVGEKRSHAEAVGDADADDASEGKAAKRARTGDTKDAAADEKGAGAGPGAGFGSGSGKLSIVDHYATLAGRLEARLAAADDADDLETQLGQLSKQVGLKKLLDLAAEHNWSKIARWILEQDKDGEFIFSTFGPENRKEEEVTALNIAYDNESFEVAFEILCHAITRGVTERGYITDNIQDKEPLEKLMNIKRDVDGRNLLHLAVIHKAKSFVDVIQCVLNREAFEKLILRGDKRDINAFDLAFFGEDHLGYPDEPTTEADDEADAGAGAGSGSGSGIGSGAGPGAGPGTAAGAGFGSSAATDEDI